MAARRISSLLSRSLSASASASSLLSRGKNPSRGRSIYRFITATALEEPITPPVQISYTQHFINGKFVDAASGKTFPAYDPRTGEVIAHVAEGDNEDVNRAVAAARKAFDEGPWPKMSAYERSLIMLRFADLVDKHRDELAALESWNSGKPYEQSAKSELPSFARLFRYYAGWADKIHGLTVPADSNHYVQTLHEPIGVAGQIIPWNFPLIMLAWKVGPALACGNTIVLKSAEQTPLTALHAAKLFQEAGLPPGVLNIVSGYGPSAGAALASHMNVDKLAFTGSTETGKIILELAAKSNLKSVTLELGGKSPFIVCEDADVDKAVELAHHALFFNQGQCCCAGSRTYVHERVYDEFVEKAKARALRRVVGDPFKKGVEQGPQIRHGDSLPPFYKARSMLVLEETARMKKASQTSSNSAFFVSPVAHSSGHTAGNPFHHRSNHTSNRSSSTRNSRRGGSGARSSKGRGRGGGREGQLHQQQYTTPWQPMSSQQQQWSFPPWAGPWQPWATPPCPYPTANHLSHQPSSQRQIGLLGPRPQQAHMAASTQQAPSSYAPTDIQAAMHTLSITPPDNQWYMDTGATSHMTANGGFSNRDAFTEM